MRKTYYFEIDCVSAKGEDISEMVDLSREISYQTFFSHVNLNEVMEIFPFYERDSRLGLTLKNDWAVSYFKSWYRGRPCYFIVHSAIEYVFTKY